MVAASAAIAQMGFDEEGARRGKYTGAERGEQLPDIFATLDGHGGHAYIVDAEPVGYTAGCSGKLGGARFV
ncbi:MAG TPA: hypothetical protein VI320_22570 [Terracidiphilus sp.]